MAKHRRVSGDDAPIKQEPADVPAYWSVDDSRWPTVRPDLPEHVADLLAPPIVVGVARVAATSRLTPPGAAPARRTPPTPATRGPVGPNSGSGPVGSGPVGGSPVGAGPVGGGPVGATPVGAGRHRRAAERRH
ncbi:hypothetical protein [Micromonospora sp. URMC 103]|uniref:hypothetical protein n=1 Tax=Micromonospora sp. URMC 103 TaxID=3423406 RepID=UPI003F1B1F10